MIVPLKQVTPRERQHFVRYQPRLLPETTGPNSRPNVPCGPSHLDSPEQLKGVVWCWQVILLAIVVLTCVPLLMVVVWWLR